jgi:putative ABC transport system permease protein
MSAEWFTKFRLRIQALWKRQQLDRDLDDEVAFHLAMREQKNRAAGAPADEARYAARRQFGNSTSVKETSRDMWTFSPIETFWRDVRYGARLLAKNPGFSLIAILTLALGIGATTATYSVTYATLIEALPYPRPDRLVMVWPQLKRHRVWGASTGDFLDWKQQNTVFSDLNAAMSSGPRFNLATNSRPEYVVAQAATPGYYDMIGIPFMLGRNFLPEEGTLGKEHVVVLTNKLWKKLGADRDIVGHSLRMNGELYTVVGVAAPGPLDRIQFDLVVPLVFKPEEINHGNHWLFVMGRLKPGVSLAEANLEMGGIASRIAQDHPDTNKGWEVSVEPLQNDFLPSDTRATLWLLLGAVAFVLGIACVNVANLLLARSTVREREVAVRVSLGASRVRIFGQLLMESLILAVLGGVAGVALAAALVKIIVSMLPDYMLPSEAHVRLSVPVLIFALIVTLSAGILFGCAPAWQASDTDPNCTLKETGTTGSAIGRRRLRQALVIMQFALAMTLLAGAGLAIRSFWNLTQVDLGARTDHILTFTVPVPNDRLPQSEQMIAFYRDLLARMQSLPGVSAAVVATGLPVQGPQRGVQFDIAGTPAIDPMSRPGTAFQAVTPGYFETFGIQVLRGRSFNQQDTASGVPVAVVNENFVRSYLPNVDPLKQHIVTERLVPGSQAQQALVQWQIVGVFCNVRSFGLRNDDIPEMDVPFWQSPWPQAEMAVRTANDPARLTSSIEDVFASVEPDLPVANVRTMTQIVDSRLAGDRFSTALYGGFAAVALVLAAIGIYGVLGYAVAQRTHEIGLRLALGAGSGQVLRMILGEGITLAFFGLGLGAVGACLVGRVLKSMLYGVAAIDAGVLAVVAITLLVSAVLACYVPARRASRVDPMIALRYE